MPVTPATQILPLTGLIDYQAGGIVSRVIMKADTGNITLFAFDLGQELSEHSAPYDALVQVLDGEVEIRISGASFRLKAGEAIIMPSDDPHAVLAISKFKMLLTMMKA
jgi:quercetin dioxygenase-like cupin family protein